MKRIGTQRGFAWCNHGDGVLMRDTNSAFVYDDSLGDETDVPVLVVPEANVSRCKHDNETAGAYCPDCGSYRRWSDSRWQRPRVLRVARAKR